MEIPENVQISKKSCNDLLNIILPILEKEDVILANYALFRILVIQSMYSGINEDVFLKMCRYHYKSISNEKSSEEV